MDANLPKVTIITVVYNGEKYLEQTIKSITNQTYKNIEYIIIDGGSKDRTIDIIKRYEPFISYWQSEPDKGIYDAMNKGLQKATGSIVAFLNADDWYEADSIQSIVDVFIAYPTVDFVFGDVVQIDPLVKSETTYRVRLNEAHRLMPFGHPALFVKTAIHKQIPFDLSFRIAADYDFVLTLLENKYPYQYLNKKITNFRLEGVSATQNMMKENYLVLKKHFGTLQAVKGLLFNLALHNFWKLLYKLFSDQQITALKNFIKKLVHAKA